MRLFTEPGSKVALVVGLSLGLVAIVAASMVPDEWPTVVYTAALAGIFGVAALMGTAFSPRGAGTTGVLIAAPMTVFLLGSVLFAGNVVAFARHDILILAGVLAGAFAGAYIGRRLFRKTAESSPEAT